MENTDLNQKRFIESNEAVIKGYEDLRRLNINDPDYAKKFEAVSQAHKQIVEDAKNEMTRQLETEKMKIEREKNEMEKVLEDERFAYDKLRHAIDTVVDIFKVVGGIALGVATIRSTNWRFQKSTEKEADDAYLTMTSKETVRDGLREPDARKWKFW